MASNIASTAGFTSANMKPASGEQIDALWGQNIADNTGQLRARPLPIYGWAKHTDYTTSTLDTTASEIDQTVAVTTIFNEIGFRPPGHNHLIATFYAGGSTYFTGGAPDIYGTFIWGVYGDLGTYLNTSSYTQPNNQTYTFGSTFGVSIDFTTYVSEGSFFEFRHSFSGSARDFANGGPYTGSMIYQIGTMKFKTTWIS
jgi:hypothetical protein